MSQFLLMISALLGFTGVAFLTFRVITTYGDMDWLHKALAGGVATLLLGTAVASVLQVNLGAEATIGGTILVIVTRIVAILVCVLWPKLIGKGMPSARA